jgi:pentatricopeptide repeat protein
MFQRLEKRGLQPKIETMNKMIQLYALNGRVNTALDFKNTFSKYDLVPDIKTYNLLVLVRIFENSCTYANWAYVSQQFV